MDGKFIFNGDIPEGQGSVNELLAECFELSYDLRVDAEMNAEEEEEANEDETPSSGIAQPDTSALAETLADTRLDTAAADTETRA